MTLEACPVSVLDAALREKSTRCRSTCSGRWRCRFWGVSRAEDMRLRNRLQCHLCKAMFPPRHCGCATSAWDRSRSSTTTTRSDGHDPREDRIARQEPLALSRAAADRGRAAHRPIFGLHAARQSRSPREEARRSRAVPEGRLGQSSDASRTRIVSCRSPPRARSSSDSRCSAARRRAISPTACRPTPRDWACSASCSSRTIWRPARFWAPASTIRRWSAIKGNYDDVNRLCTQIAEKVRLGIREHQPASYYAEGAKTYGFEIAEQLGWKFPRHVVSPVAGGTLLPRIARGVPGAEGSGVGRRRPAGDSRGAGGGLRAGDQGARGRSRVPRSREAEHHRTLDCDRQPGRRIPGAQRDPRERRIRRDGDRQRDSRRGSADRANRGHLHRAGRRHDAWRARSS